MVDGKELIVFIQVFDIWNEGAIGLQEINVGMEVAFKLKENADY